MVNVLAIGAHPDDIEIGCSGTLALHKLNKDKVYQLVLTQGEASGDPEIRKKECETASEFLSIDKLFFGGLKDTMIKDGIETITIIEDIINTIKPDFIYTHTFMDTHQDHRNAAYATLSAARKCKKIFMYEGPATLRNFVPQVFINIEKTFERKKKVTRMFSSQSQKLYLAAEAVEGLARHRGYQCGLKVAEAFEVGKLVIDLNEFCRFLDKPKGKPCELCKNYIIGDNNSEFIS